MIAPAWLHQHGRTSMHKTAISQQHDEAVHLAPQIKPTWYHIHHAGLRPRGIDRGHCAPAPRHAGQALAARETALALALYVGCMNLHK